MVVNIEEESELTKTFFNHLVFLDLHIFLSLRVCVRCTCVYMYEKRRERGKLGLRTREHRRMKLHIHQPLIRFYFPL